jgi:hypothetical protein
VSRDGVIDMTGSVTELCIDAFENYDAACWMPQPGIPRDPVCTGPSIDRAMRGASWETGIAVLHVARRSENVASPTTGFRCAYRDEP